MSHGRREDSDLVQPDSILGRGAEDVGEGELQEAIGGRVIHLYTRPFAASLLFLRSFLFPFSSLPVILGDEIETGSADDAQHAAVGGDHEARVVAPREAHGERDVQDRARTAEDEVGAQTEAGDEVGRLRVCGHAHREGCAAPVRAGTGARWGAWDGDGEQSRTGIWIEARGGIGVGVGIGGDEGVGGAEEV